MTLRPYLVTFLIVALGCSCSPKKPPGAPTNADVEFGKTLARYGFVELRPPSTLLPPGTVVQVRNRQPMQAGIVCTQKAAFGPNLQVENSPSKTTSVDSVDNQRYAFDASTLPLLKAKAEYAVVEKLTMKLSNVRVLELSEAAVYDAVSKRSEACKNAMQALAGDPSQTISVIKSVLAADVAYGVEFKPSVNIDISAKIGLVKDLAVELGANSSTVTEQGVSGSSLYWGVIDEVRLAQVGVVMPTGVRAASPGERLFQPAEGAVTLDPKAMIE